MLTSKNVDWSGRLIGRCGFQFRPVPVINRSSAIYASILYWSKILQAALLPSPPEIIFAEVSRLKLHFPGVSMCENENEILIRDYILDLSIFPADLIELVCREYRHGNNQYFPKSGKLRSMLIQHLAVRVSKSNRLLSLIEASEDVDDQ